MLRRPNNDAEIATATARLSEARALMISALSVLDDTPVATGCDAHLDLAIHTLGHALEEVKAGRPVFLVVDADDRPASF